MKKVRFSTLAELLAAAIGALAVAANLPWQHILADTIPSGGDMPAHLVLMTSLKEAFLQHFSIIHYSYSFWGGFEMFQSYFPLPYLSGALLSVVLPFNVAFKLVGIFGIVALPIAFYLFCRWTQLSLPTRFCAALLAVNFLYTEAHTIWGGNIFSTMAGSIGHSWSIVFFVLAFGRLLEARSTGHISLQVYLYSSLAIASHFYALFMLFVAFLVFLGEDLLDASLKRRSLADRLWFYRSGVIIVLLSSWWIAPLIYYRSFTSEFGGTWDITLLSTLRPGEQVVFGVAAVVSSIYVLLASRFASQHIRTILFFVVAFALAFFLSETLSSTAFNNVRLWPSLYLALHLLTLAVIHLWTTRVVYSAAVVAVGLWLILPGDEVFAKARKWVTWNYEGMERKEGWAEFSALLSDLRELPPSRISFEASEQNNQRLGSGRAFEALPFLTSHQLIEGGIVASATFPGIGYSLQCMTSKVCAGWPPGSIVPDPDIPRAIDLMRSLGIAYHITSSEEHRELFRRQPDAEEIFTGDNYSIFAIHDSAKLAVAYDSLPVVRVQRPHSLLLNTLRWDRLRHALFAFLEPSEPSIPNGTAVSPVELFNFLVREWSSERRVSDRGQSARRDRELRVINGFLFSWDRPFNLSYELERGLSPYIADQVFSPWVVVARQQEGTSEVALPLIADHEGDYRITISSDGYRATHEDLSLDANSTVTVHLRRSGAWNAVAPFALLRFHPIPGVSYRYLDVTTSDDIRPGFPGDADFEPTLPTTTSCNASVELRFHEIALYTDCPGRPHLIKVPYYPKWTAEVPIYRGTFGFMIVTPTSNLTVLRHVAHWPDILSTILSWATATVLVVHRSMLLARRSRESI